MGRGHYTEKDIKEAARAFTGWGANLRGEFIFRRGQHDFGSKTVLGRTGNFDGDDVLDILLEEKQTAQYITQKIWKFFVHETPDTEKISWLADRFYKNNYDISKLLEDIFTADWFYEEKYIGTRIKSPIELMVGIQRMLPMEIEKEETLLVLQRQLGQILFFPPNVAGWPGGKSWIDSSSLMMRMRIPKLINDTDEINMKPKDDDDTMMGRMDDEKTAPKMNAALRRQVINADVDWKQYVKHISSTEREKLINAISGALLQTKTGVDTELIKRYSDESGRENFIKTATIQIMCTPEYQLC